ncbi:MAG: mechanosensitive ion channel family protein [Acidimicrobiales bacterium]|nr:mechanosensitive ion channel family protein [Acidimicrobiales bacterium]
MPEEIQELTSACGSRPGLFCEFVYNQTGSYNAARIASWFVERPLRILLIILVAWVIRWLLQRAIDRFVARIAENTEIDVTPLPEDTSSVAGRRALREHTLEARSRQRAITIGAVLNSASTLGIVLVAGLLVLSELDLNLAPLIASAGIAGLAIGFGAQSMVKDFLAGIFIILEDQYGVGDIVNTGLATGKVEEVSLRTTRLRDQAGTLWIVPNGEIQRVGNTSQLWSNAVIDVEVSYDTDLDYAISVIKATLDEIWMEADPNATVIAEPEVLGVDQLGESSVVIRAVVKCEPAEQWSMGRIARKRIKEALDAAGIEIPFAQRTVWVRSMGGDAPPSDALAS